MWGRKKGKNDKNSRKKIKKEKGKKRGESVGDVSKLGERRKCWYVEGKCKERRERKKKEKKKRKLIIKINK